MPQPAGAREGVSPAGSSACGPVPEGLSVGAIGWSRRGPPVRWGVTAVAGRSFRPFQLNSFTSWRSSVGAAGPRGVARIRRAVLAGVNRAIWLILPVVICLSQRLSHARVRSFGKEQSL